ncbi:MAG: helix-turn-helix domain-containing protein [Bryobacteraceae bacterium]|jgi:AraC-like DNA-binding protein
MSACASTLTDLRPGQPFIPKMMFYGSMVPDSVMSLRTLKEGPKLLLARLYKFAGDKDRCNPSLRSLAKALGTSEDKVGRWLKDLERHGFIRTVRHARKEAERLLLWHSELSASLRPETIGDSQHDSAKPRNHINKDESAELRNHALMIPQNRGDDSAKTASVIPQNRGSHIKTEGHI